ncbi:hypothetical protein DV737_g3635, partial [Chaetothyriales sp. CBS 132003]
MTAPRFTQKLNGQRVLPIGGTGGVGMAVAQALAEHGAEIILSSSREAKVKRVIDDLASQYAHAKSGISGYTCEGEEVAEDQKVGQVRTIASIPVAKIGIKYIDKARDSSITFTGGSTSERPIAGGFGQCSRSSPRGSTGWGAFDLAAYIRVNVDAPGVIETDLWQGMGDEGKRQFFKQHEASIPTGKVGQPDDLAEAYLYCLRDKNATGIVVDSNSGVFLQWR